MSDYPEHDKLTALEGKNEVVGDFITWLGENGYQIAAHRTHRDGRKLLDPFWFPVGKTTEGWIAEHFGIDMKVLEAEKRSMLDSIRAAAR